MLLLLHAYYLLSFTSHSYSCMHLFTITASNGSS